MKAEYLIEAKTWRYQLYQAQSVWLKRSLVMNGLLGILSVLLVFCLVNAAPVVVKTVVVEKDKSSGHYTVNEDFKSLSYRHDWALTRYNLMHYVEFREQYHFDNIEQPYQEAYYMSSDKVRGELKTELGADNKHSPYANYQDKYYVTVHVNNIQSLDKDHNSALVEFEQTLHDVASRKTKRFVKQAIVRWQYSDKAQPYDWYARNPFNFKVTYYQKNQLSLARRRKST